MVDEEYRLRIGRRTIDKLGIRLYDRASAVIAELISNAYDADATQVTVEAPIDQYLAKKHNGKLDSSGMFISVTDNGHGMSPDEMKMYYLVVGSDRRTRQASGDTSPKGRPVTGRKGVGKLAPFGICRRIEVESAGGEWVTDEDTGESGYRVAHIILDYEEITQEEDSDYLPTVGSNDGKLRPSTGTKITLTDFLRRRVPDEDTLAGQIGRRFGFSIMDTDDWRITLKNYTDLLSKDRELGRDVVPLMPGTKLTFDASLPTTTRTSDAGTSSRDESGADIAIKAGFYLDEKFYPIKGWVAYTRVPSKSDFNLGVKIYCRGKFATSTQTFNMSAGFHGEWDVRSYLVGELHCDWLDEEEDLIHTDRQNIQWSSEEGAEFQIWGQKVVKEIGRRGRKPAQDKVEADFAITHDLPNVLMTQYPSTEAEPIRKRADDLARRFARKLTPAAALDKEASAYVLELALSFAPHLQLYDKLKSAADDDETPTIAAVSQTLAEANIAETHALGALVRQRLAVLERTKRLIRTPGTSEAEMQKAIEGAPWMVRPEWTPLSKNSNLKRVKSALEAHLSSKFGSEVVLSAIEHPTKKPDFVMVGSVGPLQVVELKKPGPNKKFDSGDWDRMLNYIEAMDAFFINPGNKPLLENIRDYQITLVADTVNLVRSDRMAYDSMVSKNKIRQLTWDAFLEDTEKVHQEFLIALDEAG